MKRILSIVLALLLVVTPTVWAAPTLLTVESAQENVAEVVAEEKATLSAAITTKPGLNMLTGTTALLDAEGVNASIADLTNVMSTSNYNKSTGAVIDNPVKTNANSSNKVYTLTADPSSATGTTFFTALYIVFNTPFADERPIYTSYKVAKVNNSVHKSIANSWVLVDSWANPGDTAEAFSVSTNSGWVSIDKVIDYSTVPNSDGYIQNWIRFQHESSTGNETPTTFYFDDIGFYPLYKITYMDKTGENELYSEYSLFDDDGNFITNIDVKPQVFDHQYYGSWSDEVGGEAIENCQLENEDVVLYALSDGVEVVLNGINTQKNELSYIGESTELTADFGSSLELDNSKITWSVEGSAIELSSRSGKTVTATAKALGTSTVTVSFDGMSKSITLTVKDAFDIVATNTYVGSDLSATISLTFKEDYSSGETVTWSKTDVNNVASLTNNGDNTVTVASAGGSGVVTVTATLDSDKTKTKSLYFYVTDEAISGGDVATVVIGSASVSVIEEDAGSAVIDAKSYSTDGTAGYDVTYSLNDSSLAKLINNADGTSTVEAVKNGNLVVTATSVFDTDASCNFAVEIENQKEKYAKYELRYLGLGNSFILHNEYDGWTWEDPENGWRGMAASRVEYDYFNRTMFHLINNNKGYKVEIEGEKLPGNSWEGTLTSDLVTDILEDTTLTDEQKKEKIIERATDASLNGSTYVQSLVDKLKEYKPNILTIQLAENVRCKDPTALEAAYDALYGTIYNNMPDDCIVVVVTKFSYDNITAATIKMAEKYGFLVNDMSFVATWHENQVPAVTREENPYYAFGQYAGSPTVQVFGSHPGDYGHNAIAEGNAEQINTVLASTIASEYIYIPEELTIVGSDSVSQNEVYTVTATPAEAETDVKWSVDNVNYATIDENGILTPVNNGTVVITAKSIYNDDVIATKTVTITGQTPCYTIKYDAGTDDTSVKGLPEAFDYAKGEYVLSDDVPTRNGYKFTGWSTTKDGTPVKTVQITGDTTVYATWELAYKWTFDVDDDYESIGFTGLFNDYVRDGVLRGMPFESACSVYFDHLLLDSMYYTDFRFKMLVDSSESDQKLKITINTTNGDIEFNADIADSEMNEYTFSLEDVTGTITGFEIVPSVLNATIKVDEIEFILVSRTDYLDVTEAKTVVDADDGVYIIDTLNIAQGASVVLKNGVFVINNITGIKNAITLDDANLITEADIDNYVVIDLGKKASESNTRYVQANGLTYEANEKENKLGLLFDEETIVTVTEKSESILISEDYYCIDNSGNVTKIDVFDNALTTKSSAQIRTDEHAGIRFRAGITHDARDNEDIYQVVEYGFIVARAKQLEDEGAQLNFEFSNIVSGAAYIKDDSGAVTTNYVYENLDEEIIFTGLLTNIKPEYYTAVLSARPYIKIKTSNDIHTVYGDVISRSIYQVALSVLADDNNGLKEEQIKFVQSIIDYVQPDDESFIYVGGLWGN